MFFAILLIVQFFGFFVKSHHVSNQHKKMKLSAAAQGPTTELKPIADPKIIRAISQFVFFNFVFTAEEYPKLTAAQKAQIFPIDFTIGHIYDLRDVFPDADYEMKFSGINTPKPLPTDKIFPFHQAEKLLDIEQIGKLRSEKNEHYLMNSDLEKVDDSSQSVQSPKIIGVSTVLLQKLFFETNPLYLKYKLNSDDIDSGHIVICKAALGKYTGNGGQFGYNPSLGFDAQIHPDSHDVELFRGNKPLPLFLIVLTGEENKQLQRARGGCPLEDFLFIFFFYIFLFFQHFWTF
jgi:hypothetical protein